MKVIAISNSTQQNNPGFKAKFNTKSSGFKKFFKMLNNHQRECFIREFNNEKNTERVKNIKVLGKDITFNLVKDTTLVADKKFQIGTKLGGLFDKFLKEDPHVIYLDRDPESLLSVSSFKGEEFVEKIIQGMENYANKLTEKIKNSNKYIKNQIKEINS